MKIKRASQIAYRVKRRHGDDRVKYIYGALAIDRFDATEDQE